MYLDFFKLRELPFRLAPQPRFLYWSAGHAGAIACMRSARARQNGCAALVGARGAGKTTLLEWLAREESDGTVARFNFPPRSESDLREVLLGQADGEPKRGPLLVICDNAHTLNEQLLLALVQKSVLPPSQAEATRIVLAGEPLLARNLQKAGLADFAERGGEVYPLTLLTAEEVTAYIAHRLELAGGSRMRRFSSEVCAEIYRETKGNPRLINALCDAAMSIACERELQEVGPAEVRRGLEEMARLTHTHGNDVESPEFAAASDEVSSSANSPAIARIRLLHHGTVLFERALPAGRVRVGRDADNELRIEGKFVSRHHCQIVSTDRTSLIEDVSSTNGLFVNERRVRHHRLKHGDVVQIGDYYLQYVDLRPSEHAPAASPD